MANDINTSVNRELTGSGYYYVTLSDADGFVKTRTPGCYTYLYLLSGTVKLMINGESGAMVAYDYLLALPDDELRISSDDETAGLFVLYVSDEEQEKMFGLYGARVKQAFLAGKRDLLSVSGDYNVKLKVDELYERILCYGDEQRLLSKLFLSEIFSGLVRKFHRRENNDEIPKKFVEAMLAMREPENLQNGVPALEKLTNYGRAQLCRLVKKYYKTTPHDYVKNLRMSFAYNMIRHTDTDYETIAENVGYRSFSQFYKSFKEKYSVTPAALRSGRDGGPVTQ